METNNTNEAEQLQSALPCISMETIEELTRRDLLQVGDDYWRFGDDSNGVTRKLNQRQKWMRGDNKGAAWHRLIGLDDVVAHDRKYVLLAIEGSKDALAAAEIAHCIDALPVAGITCALGSGYRPIPCEIHKLAGRWVGVIGDNDDAGHKTTAIVSDALCVAGVAHAVWDWSKWPPETKDLFAVVMRAMSGEKTPITFVQRFGFFSPSFPSQCSGLQVFKSSSPETQAGLGDDERLGIVAPYIVTKRGSGNSLSFQLARKLKTMKLDMNDINEVIRLWFRKSQPLLPPDATEEETVRKFFDQLQHVRFTEPALKAACERANKAKPPFIAARDGDDELAKLAALHRELQRDARDRPYICPISVVVDFIPVRWRSQAGWLTHVLEDEGVIECVERGASNKVGVKGKPTYWRYKFPLDP